MVSASILHAACRRSRLTFCAWPVTSLRCFRTPSAPGQHLLRDQLVLNSIVKAGELKKTDQIIEVGPGDGRMTSSLLDAVPNGRVTAVELGLDMIARLEKKVLGPTADPTGIRRARLTIVNEDACHQSVAPLLTQADCVIANLPYSISSKFLRQLVLTEEPARWRSCVFLVQEEFAQKVASLPHRAGGLENRRVNVDGGRSGNRGGSSESYGHLAVLVGARATVELIGELVPPEAFKPPPAVQSRVLRLKAHSQGPLVSPSLSAQWYAFVRLCFTNKRRSLKANLTSSGVLRRLPSDSPPDVLIGALSNPPLNIFANERVASIAPWDFCTIFNELQRRGIFFPNTSLPEK